MHEHGWVVTTAVALDVSLGIVRKHGSFTTGLSKDSILKLG